MTTDGPAALRRLADDIRKNDNLRFTAQLIDNFAHDWEAEREQAAADRAALAQARALLAELYDDSPCRFDHHGYCQEHDSMTEVCIMRRIAAALSGGAR